MKKILLVSLALVLALFVANGIARNNVKGLVEVPELTSAEVIDDWDGCGKDYYVACWAVPGDPVPNFYPADKWSVVIFMNQYYEWAQSCLDLECEDCPDMLEIELDYSTKDGVDADDCDPIVFWQDDPNIFCLAIDEDLVEADLEAYLEEAMADCDDCTTGCPAPTITTSADSMKVKGLDSPGKQRGTLWHPGDNKRNKKRQNNTFSNILEVLWPPPPK